MKVLNFGSLNVDYVYFVDHMIIGGETQLAEKMEAFCGGKGLNQSVALARAGITVYHAGITGNDGDMLVEVCKENKIDTSYLKYMPVKGGHTIIQVDKDAQNSIILYGGTNQMLTREFIDSVLSNFEKGNYIVLQNEVNLLDYIIEQAFEKGMKIVLNPAPYNEKIEECDLRKVKTLILNEIEGNQCTGEKEPEKILHVLNQKYPETEIVLTMGSDGAFYYDGVRRIFQSVFETHAVDTTAAGDTFTGYYLASVIKGQTVEDALRIAARAAAMAVSRAGAIPSIPVLEEVIRIL